MKTSRQRFLTGLAAGAAILVVIAMGLIWRSERSPTARGSAVLGQLQDSMRVFSTRTFESTGSSEDRYRVALITGKEDGQAMTAALLSHLRDEKWEITAPDGGLSPAGVCIGIDSPDRYIGDRSRDAPARDFVSLVSRSRHCRSQNRPRGCSIDSMYSGPTVERHITPVPPSLANVPHCGGEHAWMRVVAVAFEIDRRDHDRGRADAFQPSHLE